MGLDAEAGDLHPASPTLTPKAQAEAGEECGLGLTVFPTPTLLGLE